MDLWKFRSWIDSIYEFHMILVEWSLEEGVNWYTYENLGFKLIQLLIQGFNW